MTVSARAAFRSTTIDTGFIDTRGQCNQATAPDTSLYDIDGVFEIKHVVTHPH